MKEVGLEICFTAPDNVAIVLDLIRFIALNTLRALSLTRKSSMSPLLAVLALGNTMIHICILNSDNIASHIEGLINENFSR